MRILIAPNAFKNSISAAQAAAAIGKGLLQSELKCVCEQFPIGDGGDGTGDIIIRKFSGKIVNGAVLDPLGRNISTSFGIINNDTAVIEMANASGIRLLAPHELHPLQAGSYGTGQQIKQALDYGVNKIIVAMGGSATVDGGWGILRALGAKFFDANGAELRNISTKLCYIETTGLDKRLNGVEIIVLCDVKNKLLGDNGAAAVFAPQKGATAEEVVILERALANYADIIIRQNGIDINIERCGTAGGAAAGLFAFLNAKLVDGIDYFLTLTGFRRSLQKADLLVTGEGSIDDQTLQGKAPFGVARLAKEQGIKVVALAGIVAAEPGNTLPEYFDLIQSINTQITDLPTALRNTAENLTRTARELGNSLSRGQLFFPYHT